MARAAIGDRGIFMPIGTRGDLVMEILSMSDKLINVSGEELGPQLLAAFDSDGQISTLLQPGRLTPTTATAREGPDSHGVVYRDPGNITYFTSAVLQAAGNYGSMGTTLPSRAAAERNAAFHSAAARASPRPACPGPCFSVISGTRSSAAHSILTIKGSGLGSTLGHVALISRGWTHRSLAVHSWSPSLIIASAPSGPAGGLVLVQTATGQSLLAGLLTVTGQPSSVRRLLVSQTGAPAIDGGVLSLTVAALDGRGPAIPGAPIQLSDGVVSVSKRADRRGHATLVVRGAGTIAYVATSGTAWSAVRVRWQRPAPVKLRLAHRLQRHGRLRRLLLTVGALTARGRPVAGMPVNVTLVRPHTAELRHPLSG